LRKQLRAVFKNGTPPLQAPAQKAA